MNLNENRINGERFENFSDKKKKVMDQANQTFHDSK
jgi:hypothetical protein